MGKDKVVNHHRDVPYRILERVPEKGVLDSHGSDCGNMVIHGDNLEALKALLPEYEGRVDCVYIDPPYNTGNEGWVYNDNVNDPRIQRWLGQVVGKEGEDFSRHDKWLCMMYPRLQLLRRMLNPNGSIFISIGDDELAALQFLCNEIFGRSCFQGDIAWQRAYSPKNDQHGLPVEIEHLLCYSIDPTWKPKALERTQEMDNRYKNPDNDFDLWKSGDASAPSAHSHSGMVYAIQHPFTGELLYPPNGRCWYYEQPQMLQIMKEWVPYKLEEIDDAFQRATICGTTPENARPGVKAIMLALPLEESQALAKARYKQGHLPRLYFTSGGTGGLALKNYLSEKGGKLPTNYWPYSAVGHTDEAAKELKSMFGGKAVFQNPKPSRLIRRVLQVSCPDNGLVLDAFAGSGTTAQAVIQENEINSASRRFILCEMGDYADTITAQRARITISGYTAEGNRKTRLYEKKITARNVALVGDFYLEAKTVADAAIAASKYDKIDGPKMDSSSIIVDGVTNKGNAIPGIDSGFSYYELGPELFLPDGTINPKVAWQDLACYIWSTESKEPYRNRTAEHPFLLGEAAQGAYYLAWKPKGETVVDYPLLKTLPIKGSPTVIYASRCAIAPERLDEMNIVFKQIPRQIARL